MADEVRRAFAVLGLKPGASGKQLRRRYLTLAKRWHPDRHANNPRDQAEAAAKMREINQAYQVLSELTPRPDAPFPPSHTSPPPGPRLSREQIEKLVRSIGTEGPLDSFLQDDTPPVRHYLSIALLLLVGGALAALAARDRLYWVLGLLVPFLAGLLWVLREDWRDHRRRKQQGDGPR